MRGAVRSALATFELLADGTFTGRTGMVCAAAPCGEP